MKNRNKPWSCIKNCGACCKLTPDEREEALKVLDVEQQEIYMKMVGEDGWCTYYDTGSRRCKIYDERPYFCRVSNLHKLFMVNENEKNEFAIKCCLQQIKSVYGPRSQEIRRFQRQIRLLAKK